MIYYDDSLSLSLSLSLPLSSLHTPDTHPPLVPAVYQPGVRAAPNLARWPCRGLPAGLCEVRGAPNLALALS